MTLFSPKKHSVFCLLASLLYLLAGPLASAVELIESPQLSTQLQTVEKKKRQKIIFGQFRFESQQYLSAVPETPQLTRQQFLSARLTALSQAQESWSFDYGTDVVAGTFFSQRQTHWMVNELYASTRAQQNTLIALGRKKNNWSDLDEFWQMSLWQPKYNIDALRPEEQGLSGLFVDYNTTNFQVVGLWAPVFIPTMSPDVREENGGLQSDSRWFRSPSQTFSLGNNVNSISYKIDTSQAMDLIKNQGFALWTRVGKKSQGPWLAVGAADKPVNDLLFTRNIVVKTSSEGNVIVQPDVARHTLISTDFGYSFNTGKMTFSYLTDRPRVKAPQEEWATQRISPIYAYSSVLDWSLKSLLSLPLQMQLGYLRVFGGGIQDIESDGSNADFTLYEQRLKFSHAVSTKLQGHLFNIFKKPLNTKLYYLYDWDQKGSLLGSEFQLIYNKDWSLLAGADFLGVTDEKFNPNGFLNQYRANDRVYGGLSYVF